jgi:hypothetical protein
MAKVWQEGIKTYISDIRYIQLLCLHSLFPDPVVWQMNKGSTDFVAARVNLIFFVGTGVSISLNGGGGGGGGGELVDKMKI